MLTTEQVAERLGITPQEVYETRRRNEHPGNLGVRRGKRLLFPDDLTPLEPETTIDSQTAILWTLQGIEAKLGEMLNVLRGEAWRNARGSVVNVTNMDAAELIRQGREGEEE